VLAFTGRRRSEVSLLALALLLLTTGITVYVLDRGGAAYFLPDWAAGRTAPPIFGLLGDYLPTFIHTLAFILITAAVLWPWPRLLPGICAAWVFIESLFEVGQLATQDSHIAAAVPAWFDGVPVLEVTADYFIRGTYDPLDLVSIGIGAVIAYAVICIIQQGDPK
jgi:hypothetical protein